jgi:hypothetical protein
MILMATSTAMQTPDKKSSRPSQSEPRRTAISWILPVAVLGAMLACTAAGGDFLHANMAPSVHPGDDFFTYLAVSRARGESAQEPVERRACAGQVARARPDVEHSGASRRVWREDQSTDVARGRPAGENLVSRLAIPAALHYK